MSHCLLKQAGFVIVQVLLMSLFLNSVAFSQPDSWVARRFINYLFTVYCT